MNTQEATLTETLANTFAKHKGDPAAEALMEDLRKVLATPGAKRTDLAVVANNRSLTQRLGDSAKYVISSIVPTTWFGPNQPIQPQADKPDQGTRGRRFDFPVGSNIQYQPKSEQGAGVPFYVLRGLAESFDLLRLVIETRKDQMVAQKWEIVPTGDDKGKAASMKTDIEEVRAFFEQPSPDLTWDEWLRAVVDDDLVCGSVALYPRMNRGGALHSLIPMDVAMIKRLIDETGMTPDAPNPAYQQILKGVPAVDYTREELVYWMRNPRTWRMYGYSPVEQIITTVNIALRRQNSQLEYYTEGNIPDMILGVPESWTPEQLKDTQDWWDSVLSGNTATRRKARFVPEIKGVVLPKDAAVMLKDEADEWFSRIICFAFSIPPSALMKQVNRASGEQMAETAKEEGLLPMLSWYERKLTAVIRDVLKKPGLKFTFNTTVEVDPKVKADTNVLYVKSGIMTPDEAREDMGKEPMGSNELLVYLPTGVVPLKESADKAKQDILHPPAPPAPGPLVLNPGQTAHDQTTGKPLAFGAKQEEKKPAPVAKSDAPTPMPTIIMGDTFVRVAPGVAPEVTVGDTHVVVDQREGVPDKRTVTKHVVAKRDPVSGDLVGEITETSVDSAIDRKPNDPLVKTIKVTR